VNPTALAFLDRIRDARESTTGSLGRLSYWLEKHTTLAGRKFSFKDHEFQRDICDDKASSMVVLKGSQCGISELTARMTLGFLATNPSVTAIYGLQAVFFQTRFFKARIDPIIRESNTLSALILPAADSASFKQLTNGSQLHGAGFSPGIAVISTPSSMVVADEYDFCDPQSIATAESRLSHSPFVNEDGVRGIRRFFSTPTTEGYGVSGLYEKSNKRKRLVKCRSCSEWFWPSLLDHGVIDKWDRSIRELTAVDAQSLDDRGLLASARLLCPHCHEVISKTNLGPDYREWVAEKPDVRRMSGWQVSPFDLPAYHTPESLIRKLIETGDHAVHHWHNFALGLPYTNALNSVSPHAVTENTVVTPIPPANAYGTVSGCVAGVDIGKISWITIGKIVDGRLHIVWVEQIRLRADDGSDLEERVLELLKAYKVALCIMDAFPYTDTILRVIARYPAVRAAEYSIRDKTLPMMVAKEDDDIVKLNRSKTLSYMVKRVNAGQIKFPTMDETRVVATHLKALRQIERIKESGEVVQEWVNTGPDHYGHSLNYCNMAAQALMDSIDTGFAMAPTVKQAAVGSKYVPSKAA
jgi:hypothetical protein